MPVVRRLPNDLADQIAAGEVVERPASVVKELLENALDAQAGRVRVDVEGGGLSLLRVVDDGVGMSEEDALLAVERHATSKITSLDDLMSLSTFGFRGEALPSIASVSRFTLRTRRRGDEAGFELRIEAGKPPEVKPCGMAPGTSVEIRDLFFNVPARRKFLKSAGTESAHITDVVEALALAAPTLTVGLAREGRVVREWLRTDGGHPARARSSFAGEELAELTGSKGQLDVLALLGRPERARASTASLKLFVNGRLVRDRVLMRTVLQAYGSVLPAGRYPVGAVFLVVPPDRVDVNVHPQKAEVRFADARAVTDALFQLLSLELGRAFGLAPANRQPPYLQRPAGPAMPTPASAYGPPSSRAPAWQWSSSAGEGTRPEGRAPFASPGEGPASSRRAPDGDRSFEHAGDGQLSPERPLSDDEIRDPWGLGSTTTRFETEAQVPLPADVGTPYAADKNAADLDPATGYARSLGDAPPEGARPALSASFAGGGRADAPSAYASLRFVAQVRQTYLICEGDEGLYVLDQHAAAERVTFHRLKKAFSSRTVAIQPLLFPTVVAVSAEEAAFVDEEHELLYAAGIDARAVGPAAVAVHGVPQLLRRANVERLARDLIAQATRAGAGAFQDAIDMALATMACHGSVRAGDRLAPEEANGLLAALDEVDFGGHCPHGRPVITHLRWDELERKVGRR